MRGQDAGLVLAVLEAVRRSMRPEIHPQKPLDAAQVDEAIQVLKLEMMSNSRRGNAKRKL